MMLLLLLLLLLILLLMVLLLVCHLPYRFSDYTVFYNVFYMTD